MSIYISIVMMQLKFYEFKFRPYQFLYGFYAYHAYSSRWNTKSLSLSKGSIAYIYKVTIVDLIWELQYLEKLKLKTYCSFLKEWALMLYKMY